jgi:hypothetical protein
MTISSRTPEGEPAVCPICDTAFTAEPSDPGGEAPCPCCGHLLWFGRREIPQTRRAVVHAYSPRWCVHGAGAPALTADVGGSTIRESGAEASQCGGSSGFTERIQSACRLLLGCMIALALIWGPLPPGSMIGRGFLDLFSIVLVVALGVFIYARLVWVVGRLWAWWTHTLGAPGTKFGGVWDRELDG